MQIVVWLLFLKKNPKKKNGVIKKQQKQTKRIPFPVLHLKPL